MNPNRRSFARLVLEAEDGVGVTRL